MEHDWLERQRALIGDEATDRLKESSVMIVGIGGVGGFAAEAIARSGVGRIILVDSDTVTITNINRQIIADTTTVGCFKTELMRDRAAKINPKAELYTENVFVTKENAADLVNKYKPDWIIDCVDNVTAKLSLIEAAKASGIYIVSSMGTGNKLDPTRFKICDISKTSVCPLARVMRSELKKRGIENVDVLYSDEAPIKTGVCTPASLSFVPSVAGLMLAGHVIRKIIG